MSMTASKFASVHGVCYSTVKTWIKKGYLGTLTKDKSGKYVIDEDMPRPYKTNGIVDRDTTIISQFLDASDLEQSVHKNMFPKFTKERYERILAETILLGLVEKREPFKGVTQLISTAAGRAVLSATPSKRDKIIERILDGIPTAVALAEFGIKYVPEIVTAITAALPK